ncbi:50S ribosomal protein L33 [Lactobacillus sp. UBA5813]|nr:50S ribosomal protein L33 [Lactobacillus sp. UBA5813]
MSANIILACEETGERCYLTKKNKRNTPSRLRLHKYSPKLRRRAWFLETK